MQHFELFISLRICKTVNLWGGKKASKSCVMCQVRHLHDQRLSNHTVVMIWP